MNSNQSQISEVNGDVLIHTNFWESRLQMNMQDAIFYQWDQLEKTGCIDNFRIAAGLKEGFREGYFFADSDAYKWLEAASHMLAIDPPPRLKTLVDAFITILQKAQSEDGYLYTYNQIHFGSSRWQNLQIEHEMYCLGHLIEASVSHFKATGEDSLLLVGRKAAELLIDEFTQASPIYTDGHEEIEIALIRLSRITGVTRYRDLARRFLDRRGKTTLYGIHFLAQLLRSTGRMNTVRALRRKYFQTHEGEAPIPLPGHNRHLIPAFTPLRMAASVVTGKYTQQHTSLKEQFEPVGHAVRSTYLNTATAMLARDEADASDLPRLTWLWNHMVSRRMFVTGGIGAVPLVEGFGRDYELDPEVAYAETCAALGSMFWAHEMSLLTEDPKYEDLYEWQLYNAASVGMGMDGKTYFYNNPLTCRRELERQGWYDIPCCPSNLSRTWASLRENSLTVKDGRIAFNQYIPGNYEIEDGFKVALSSTLPWSGKVSLTFSLTSPKSREIVLRIPAWTGEFEITLNGSIYAAEVVKSIPLQVESAVGLHFENSCYVTINRDFCDGDEVVINLSMPLCLRVQDKRIKGCGGMTALTRGPLVYCLEQTDNPVDIFSINLAPESFENGFDADLLGGAVIVHGKTRTGESIKFIPYMLWGNRGKSKMTIFFKTD